LRARADIRSGKQLLQSSLHRALRQIEAGGDFFVRQSLRHEMEHARFSRRERLSRYDLGIVVIAMANRDWDCLCQEMQFPVRFRPPPPAAKPLVDEEPASGQSQPLTNYSGEEDFLHTDQRFQHGRVLILISG
jgi:hypothetical protein